MKLFVLLSVILFFSYSVSGFAAGKGAPKDEKSVEAAVDSDADAAMTNEELKGRADFASLAGPQESVAPHIVSPRAEGDTAMPAVMEIE